MNVIDSLVVTLGLDTSGLKQGAKDATSTVAKMSAEITTAAEAGEKSQVNVVNNVVMAYINFAREQKKAADAAVQNNKRLGSSVEGVAQSGEKALRTFGALFLLFAGAHSVKSFVTDMLGVDAALGRTAKSIGQTPEALSGIGRAVERMGGTLTGAVGGLKGLSDAFESMRTTGNSAVTEPLARLQGLSGRAIKFGSDVRENFYSIADALHAMKDQTMADYLGRQILGDEGLVNLAKRGGAAARTEEAASPKVTKQQTEDAQKLQAQLAAVQQGFQDIGNAILMDSGPPMIKAAEWVKDLVDRNRGLIETKVAEWVKDVGRWFDEHRTDVENFGEALGTLATAAGTLATAFASQSPAMQALEAFGLLMGGTVLRAVTAVGAAATALAAIPVPAWALAAMGLSAAAQWQGAKDTAHILGSDDPTKNDVVVDPESGMATKVGPGEGNQGTGSNTGFNRQTGFIPWIKSLFGFGDGGKAKDDLATTAKATAELRDLVKNGTSLNASVGFGGVTAASGGLGGSGQHFGGGSSPGASLGDRIKGGRGAGPASTRGAQQKANAAAIADELRKAGVPNEGIAAVLGSMQTESGLNPAVPENSYNHGHHGLWQWDSRRWPKIEAWIRSQGGNPMDARWQTKAYIAEGQAKPGDAIYDNEGTSGGFRDVMGSKGDLGKAVHGVQRSERFGVGEEGGRAANARQWLGNLPGSTSPTAQAPVPAGTSEAAIGDAAAFAAEQRLKAGGSDPKDRALLDRYRAQQNAPKAAAPATPAASATPPKHGKPLPSWMAKDGTAEGMSTTDFRDPKYAPAPTVGDAARHLLRLMHRAGRLGSHGGGPVPVTMDERGAKHINEALRRRAVGAGRAHYNHDIDRAMGHAAALHRMTQLVAGGGSYSSHVDRSSETTINGGIHVHTAATDARGIAADIEPHLHRGQAAGRADYGLA